jgi:type II secretory pathway component GspD/PulD (secretin)
MRLLLLVLSLTLLATRLLHAASPQSPASKLIEFRDAPLADALNQLGRDAKVRLILDESIVGTVTIRYESTSPMEALRLLAEVNGLGLSEVGTGSDIYLVIPVQQLAQKLGALDNPAFPAAVARYKRRLFEALRREGFSEQQALTIVAADRTPIADVPIIKPK